MIHRKLIPVFFLLALLFSACVKKVKPTFFTGKVEHVFTHKPLEGIEIQIFEIWHTGTSILGNSGERSLGKVVSNSNGEFRFNIDTVDNDKTYEIIALLPQPLDTNDIGSQFVDMRQIIDSRSPQKEILKQLWPSGYTSFGIDELTWNSIPADTIVVETPYSKENGSKKNVL